MAREAQQFARVLEHLREQRVARVEPRFDQAVGRHLVAVPPGHGAREPVDLVEGQAEGAADVAQRRARTIGGERGGERGAIAPVALVEVLHHLLAPRVLEVDVDVRRLVALARDEALEQHLHARGIDLGDAQRVAHRGVGGRATPLAQDAAPAGEADDVVHGQEIGLVAQLGHQREFVIDLRRHCGRDPGRVALREPFLHEPAQPARCGLALGHQLARILVAQRLQRERAARGDVDRLRQQFGRIQACKPSDRVQAALGIGQRARAQRMQRLAAADGRQHVVQLPALAHMHPHRTAGHQRQPGTLAQRAGLREQRAIVRPAQQRHPDPAAAGEGARKVPQRRQGGMRRRFAPRIVGRRIDPARSFGGRAREGHRRGRRHRNGQAARQARLEVGGEQPVLPLGRAGTREAHEFAQVAVAVAIGSQQQQTIDRRPVLDAKAGADDQVQPAVLRRQVRAHHARHRALVGQRERAIAQRAGAVDQFLGVRGPLQETVVRQRVEFGVDRQHACGARSVPARAAARGPWIARARPQALDRTRSPAGACPGGHGGDAARVIRMHVFEPRHSPGIPACDQPNRPCRNQREGSAGSR